MGKTNKDESEQLRKKPRKRDDSQEERKDPKQQKEPDEVWTHILNKINEDKQRSAKPKPKPQNQLSKQTITEYEAKNRDKKLVQLMQKI